jgi:uncharacterized protein (TIGR03435 family)
MEDKCISFGEPRDLRRRVAPSWAACLILLRILFPCPVVGQVAPGVTKFEVAAVRPTTSVGEFNQQFIAARAAGQAPPASGRRISGRRVEFAGETIKSLVSMAYGIDARLIVGPAWVNEGEARFAIQAQIPDGATERQLPDMLRSLLEERFHLVIHRSNVEQPAYALVLAKNGPKLKDPHEIDSSLCERWEEAGSSGTFQICRITRVVDDQNVNIRVMKDSAWGPYLWSASGSEWHEEFYRITMPKLADLLETRVSPGSSEGLGGAVGRTSPVVKVIDRTAIVGAWAVVLDSVVGDPGAVLSSLTSSLEKQGLRLERTKAPIEKLIIDEVYRIPTEN